jgi:hypothetical protein
MRLGRRLTSDDPAGGIRRSQSNYTRRRHGVNCHQHQQHARGKSRDGDEHRRKAKLTGAGTKALVSIASAPKPITAATMRNTRATNQTTAETRDASAARRPGASLQAVDILTTAPEHSPHVRLNNAADEDVQRKRAPMERAIAIPTFAGEQI